MLLWGRVGSRLSRWRLMFTVPGPVYQMVEICGSVEGPWSQDPYKIVMLWLGHEFANTANSDVLG